MNESLQKKIDQSIKLLRATCGDELVEIAYSGGKDSDVILQLAKEAGINYRAIYKNTTIDPPFTLKHVKDMGVEVLMPRNGNTFFKIVEKKGNPSRWMRFCCKELKEYKVLDKAVIGVRKEESRKRNEIYNEPTACRFYGNKKNHVEQIYPILDWTTEDVKEFLIDRGIKVAPLYYDENGEFHAERRLGCMCCPLASHKKRIEEFKKYPNMVKAYIRADKVFLETHKDSKIFREHGNNAYRYFYHDIFIQSAQEWEQTKHNLFGEPDFKKFLEEYFNIKFKEE